MIILLLRSVAIALCIQSCVNIEAAATRRRTSTKRRNEKHKTTGTVPAISATVPSQNRDSSVLTEQGTILKKVRGVAGDVLIVTAASKGVDLIDAALVSDDDDDDGDDGDDDYHSGKSRRRLVSTQTELELESEKPLNDSGSSGALRGAEMTLRAKDGEDPLEEGITALDRLHRVALVAGKANATSQEKAWADYWNDWWIRFHPADPTDERTTVQKLLDYTKARLLGKIQENSMINILEANFDDLYKLRHGIYAPVQPFPHTTNGKQ